MVNDRENKRTVKVKIYGKEYSIISAENPDYVEEVARYVDSKMSEVDRSGISSSPIRVAVLAALNITDELFNERRAEDQKSSEIKRKSTALVDKISSVLND